MVGPKSLMHPDVEEALPGTTYNALTRRAGPPHPPSVWAVSPLPLPPTPLTVRIVAVTPFVSSAAHTTPVEFGSQAGGLFHPIVQLYMQSLPVDIFSAELARKGAL